MMVAQESEEIGLGEPYRALLKDHNITYINCPLPDKSTPSTPALQSRFDECLFQARKCQMEGNRILVHCQGGKGRAALFICAFQARFRRWKPKKSIRVMRLTRPGTMRNPLQRMYLRKFARMYRISDSDDEDGPGQDETVDGL